MGLYDKTPVYLRMQELIRLVYSLSTHVSREYKYTLMQDIKRDVMNLTRYVFRANTADDKRPHLAFNANNYWSATENNATNAWNVNFNNGNVNNNNKTNSNNVRCVRE